MKILITGGSGYFGRNLTRIFRVGGFDVVAPTSQELNMCDLSALQTYLRAEKVDGIVHCAARGVFSKSDDNFQSIYTENIQMFENLMVAGSSEDPIILIGSGAEYDRRNPIVNVREGQVYFEWPIDAYGLSKNVISRRIKPNMRIVRSFGCFNYDEHISRFIRNSIYRIKQGMPISIPNNRVMDFFYMDDLATVIQFFLNNKTPQSINAVYKEKTDLISIAYKIYEHAGIKDYSKILTTSLMQPEYTGNGDILDSLDLPLPLIGLDEGIRRTVTHLI